jgi:hypothetical protein
VPLCHPADAQGRPGTPKPVHGRHSATGRPGSTAQAAGPRRAPSSGAVSRPFGDVSYSMHPTSLQNESIFRAIHWLFVLPLTPFASPVYMMTRAGIQLAQVSAAPEPSAKAGFSADVSFHSLLQAVPAAVHVPGKVLHVSVALLLGLHFGSMWQQRQGHALPRRRAAHTIFA